MLRCMKHTNGAPGSYILTQNAAIAAGKLTGTTVNLKTLGVGDGLTVCNFMMSVRRIKLMMRRRTRCHSILDTSATQRRTRELSTSIIPSYNALMLCQLPRTGLVVDNQVCQLVIHALRRVSRPDHVMLQHGLDVDLLQGAVVLQQQHLEPFGWELGRVLRARPEPGCVPPGSVHLPRQLLTEEQDWRREQLAGDER